MMPATPAPRFGIMATHTGNTGNVVRLPQWLPSADAARALGIAERTLRLHAERGQVVRRRDGRTVLYQVTPSADAGMPVAVANVGSAMPATSATDAGNTDALVSALERALERALRAELANASTAAELANVRAELLAARKGWARAHAGWQVCRAALDRITGA